MEAQLQRPSHGHHHYEEDPHHARLHSVIEGEGEGEQQHHGEKKSVLKKVKDKAKKLKDTIKKHGHGHEHEEDKDEEEEADEEMVNDPGVHGAQMYESTVIRSVNLPRETDVNIEKPRDDTQEIGQRLEHNLRDEGISRPSAPSQTLPEYENKTKTTLPTQPQTIGKENSDIADPKIKTEPLMGIEEDPHSPNNSPTDHSNVVTGPPGTGGKEAEVAPLVSQFDNLNVGHDSASKLELEQRSYTGSHDQFAPQSTPTKNQFNPESNPGESTPKSQDPASHSPDTSQGTITEKISSTASTFADKALSAKNPVASKLGYGRGGTPTGSQEGDHDSLKKPISESATEYAHKVYERVAGAVMSKVHGSVPAEHPEGSSGGGGSMREYLAEKLRPGDEDRALSEAITDVFSHRQVGKVMESEEVAAQLGTTAKSKREGEDAVAAGAESSGQGVVDRLKDAVGAWLGKSTGMQTAQESVGRSFVSGSGGDGGGGEGGEDVSAQRKEE